MYLGTASDNNRDKYRDKPHLRGEQSVRISAALMGHEVSTETRARISAAKMGRKHSAEARAKMSAAKRRN